jgi:hypothetical protein
VLTDVVVTEAAVVVVVAGACVVVVSVGARLVVVLPVVTVVGGATVVEDPCSVGSGAPIVVPQATRPSVARMMTMRRIAVPFSMTDVVAAETEPGPSLGDTLAPISGGDAAFLML